MASDDGLDEEAEQEMDGHTEGDRQEETPEIINQLITSETMSIEYLQISLTK